MTNVFPQSRGRTRRLRLTPVVVEREIKAARGRGGRTGALDQACAGLRLVIGGRTASWTVTTRPRGATFSAARDISSRSTSSETPPTWLPTMRAQRLPRSNALSPTASIRPRKERSTSFRPPSRGTLPPQMPRAAGSCSRGRCSRRKTEKRLLSSISVCWPRRRSKIALSRLACMEPAAGLPISTIAPGTCYVRWRRCTPLISGQPN